MKKLNLLFTALLLMCCVGTAKAVEVTIDGIKYDVITKAKQATVIIGDTKYSGDIVIPSEITYNNVTCSVTSIGEKAFYQCSGLTSITIPSSVTSIGSGAFDDCTALTNIVIPSSVTSIGNNAFSGCKGLTSITIPNSVTSIGNQAFFYCSGLTSITIPNSVTSIGDGAFQYCSGLTSITIPNSVTSIGNMAFWVCTGLTSITIPNSVTSIGNNAFSGCDGLTSITIPNSVTSIGKEAFNNCSGLTSITIPNSVKSIGEGAFAWCSELTSITIPNSVTRIGNNAFYDCDGLTSVTIPNSVTSIGDRAFYNCDGLTSVTIGNSVTGIGEEAFYGCSNLTDVYCLATDVPATNSNAFSDSYPEYMKLHVPAEAINSYKTTEPWSEFGTIVALDDETINPEPEPNPVKQEINLTTEAGLPGYISSPHDHAVINPTSPWDQGGVAAMIDGDVNTHFHTAWENVPAGPHYFEIDMGEGNTIGKFCFDYVTRSDASDDWAREFTIKGSNNGTDFELITVVDFGTNAKYGSSHSSEVLGSNDKTYRYLRFEVTNTNSMAGAGFRTYFHIAEFDLFAINESTVDPLPKPEVKVCATPTISYNNGKLSFECETEGAEFVTEVTSNDFNKFYDSEINFSATYNISVYATAAGHDNSDTVNATLCWIECDCSADDNTTDVINVPAKAVFVTSNNSTININCALEGEVVELYTSDAMYIGSTTIENGCASIQSGLSKGDIAIIKIAEKSIKVILN